MQDSLNFISQFGLLLAFVIVYVILQNVQFLLDVGQFLTILSERP